LSLQQKNTSAASETIADTKWRKNDKGVFTSLAKKTDSILPADFSNQ
jgi:hypothetical protein